MSDDHAAFRALAKRWLELGILREPDEATEDTCARELLALCGAPKAAEATREPCRHSVRGLRLVCEKCAYIEPEDDGDQPAPSEPPRTEPADFERPKGMRARQPSMDPGTTCTTVGVAPMPGYAGERPRQSEPACVGCGSPSGTAHGVVCPAPGAQRAQSEPLPRGWSIDELGIATGPAGMQVRPTTSKSGFTIWIEGSGQFVPHEVFARMLALLGTATPSPENVARARELLRDALVAGEPETDFQAIRSALAELTEEESKT